jgi:hypothetical protein
MEKAAKKLCCCDQNDPFFDQLEWKRLQKNCAVAIKMTHSLISWNEKGCKNCTSGTKMTHSLISWNQNTAKIVLAGQK